MFLKFHLLCSLPILSVLLAEQKQPVREYYVPGYLAPEYFPDFVVNNHEEGKGRPTCLEIYKVDSLSFDPFDCVLVDSFGGNPSDEYSGLPAIIVPGQEMDVATFRNTLLDVLLLLQDFDALINLLIAVMDKESLGDVFEAVSKIDPAVIRFTAKLLLKVLVSLLIEIIFAFTLPVGS